MDDDLLGKPGVWGTPHIRREVTGAASKIVYNGSSIDETASHLVIPRGTNADSPGSAGLKS